MTNAQTPHFDFETGNAIAFLGRIALQNRTLASQLMSADTFPDSDRSRAAFCMHTYAEITHNAESLGREIAAANYARVEFSAQLSANACADYLDAQEHAPEGAAARHLSKQLLLEGCEVFTAIAEKARVFKALTAVAA